MSASAVPWERPRGQDSRSQAHPPAATCPPAEVSLTVIDGANKRVLWHGTETAKYAMKQKARENNLVEASEKLASRFHDKLEPVEAR